MKEYMKIATILFIFVLLSSFKKGLAFDYKPVVKAEAEKMADAFVKKDFKSFAKYVHPKIVAMMGDKDKMVMRMTEQHNSDEKDGYAYRAVKIGDASEIIDTAETLQCTLPETITQTIPGGYMIATSSIIGISMDKGGVWYFIDVPKDHKTLKTYFKELSSKLYLGEPSKPEVFKDKK